MTPPRTKHKWLEQYPGLYLSDRSVFFVIHPITGRKASLKTKEPGRAIRIWRMLSERWESERGNDLDELERRLSGLSQPISRDENIHLGDYMARWRREVLGHQVKDGRVKWGQCHVLSRRGKHKGQPIAIATRQDYAADCQQLEGQAGAAFPLSDPAILRKIRQLLSPWLNHPTHYNGLRNTLSRVLDHAVAEGVLDQNPVKDLAKATEKRREVLIPDEAYRAITERLAVHRLNRRTFDGTWRAKVCDMIYMMSQQPIDVFGMREDQGETYDAPEISPEGWEVWGVIRFARHKTGVPIELSMNREMRDLWRWFIDFKRRQGIVSQYLMVYPMYMDVRSRARPVRHRFMQTAWRQACREAGYGDQYQLRDLRKKGLTEEYLAQGENDKGGHETEAMRKHYRLVVPPKRARSTITGLSDASQK